MVRYLKRLKSPRLGHVYAFPVYGGLGMSAPSLHRESTDSMIHVVSSYTVVMLPIDLLAADVCSCWGCVAIDAVGMKSSAIKG